MSGNIILEENFRKVTLNWYCSFTKLPTKSCLIRTISAWGYEIYNYFYRAILAHCFTQFVSSTPGGREDFVKIECIFPIWPLCLYHRYGSRTTGVMKRSMLWSFVVHNHLILSYEDLFQGVDNCFLMHFHYNINMAKH